MKKIATVLAIAAFALGAQADVTWSWWCENPQESTDLSFGLGAKCAEVETLELSLIYSGSPKVDVVQFSFWGINHSEMTGALQMAPWFNKGKEPCVQLGFLNFTEKSAFTWGFLNFADKTTVQLGLLNFNKNGFLPVFPFINLDKALFD